jgi:hypothetical protein
MKMKLMTRVFLLILFFAGIANSAEPKSNEPLILSGVIISIDNELISYQFVEFIKYKNGSIVDTLKGYYEPGKLVFAKSDFDSFINVEHDSIMLNIEIPNSHNVDGKVIYARNFMLKYNQQLFNSSYHILYIESLSLKSIRKKWGIKCKSGFVVTYKTEGTMVPSFKYIGCKE